jgi:uroporphyrinogen-III synthase
MSASAVLAGVGVVITRPRVAAEALAARLAQAGARTFVFPALAIEPAAPSIELDAVLDRASDCDLAIFVSANAVEHGLAAARRRGTWPKRVAAVGDATAAALRNSGFEAVISPRGRQDSEALAALDELKATEGRNILIFRGKGGREILRESLASRGAHVTYAECYRRFRPTGDPAPLLAAWAEGQVQAVSVLSAETLENFVAMIGPEGAARLASSALVVPHEAVGARPLARRFSRVVVAPPDENMVRALAALRVTT